MSVSWRHIILAGASTLLMAGAAEAGCTKGCPKPPPPPPPCHSCGHNGGHNVRTPDIKIGAPKIKIGGTKVNVNHGGVFVNRTNVNVNVEASASAAANASAGGSAGAGGQVIVGGGGGYFAPAPAPSMGALNICIEEEELIEKTRLVEAMVAIRAACIDDRGAPHPASQLWPEEHVQAGYEGELYRCAAGSYLQVTVGDEGGYDGASTIVCAPGEALYHTPDGQLFCRPQNPERNCFERSLLRKYGPGSKLLTIRREETYTETKAKACPVDTGGFLLSGGVGAY